MSKYKMKSASYCATNMRPSKDTSLVQYPFEINNEIDGNEDAFSTIFKMYCIECKSHLQPNVKVVSQRELLQTFSICTLASNLEQSEKSENKLSAPEVLVVQSSANRILQIIFKHFSVDKNMLVALQRTLTTSNAPSTLKLEFCNLTAKQIQFLRHILIKNPTIMELSLNGNPNANENHGTVLRGTFLTSLSLRFCKISAKGLKAICDELSSDSNQTLIYLNLSSNSVGDEGVEMIADALRVNRQLSFLNLADNQIGDDGCVVLMRVCMKFPLVLDEIIVRRQIVIRNIFKKYRELDFSSGFHKEELTESCSQKKASTTKSSKSMKSNGIYDDLHPFVCDSYPENKEIFCKGNFHLISLILAYNKISSIGYEKICEVLRYQSEMNGLSGKGLTRIILEGNDVPTGSREMNEISQLLSCSSEKVLRVASFNSSNADSP